MKKILSISFLLLTNLILLVHALVPHHHQDNLSSCILEIFSHEDFELCGHHSASCTEHRHDHSQANDIHNASYLISATLRIEKDKNSVCGPLHTLLQPAASLISQTLAAPVPEEKELPQRYKPPVPALHTVFSAQAQGLRAPPLA